MEINILNKKSLATIIADKHGLTKKESADYRMFKRWWESRFKRFWKI